VAQAIRPLLPALADEIVVAVGSIPAYQRPLEGDFGVGVRAGVEAALTHLVLEIEAGGPVPRSDVYRRLGRGEMRAGRSLDALLSAYRAGARVTWRRVAQACEARGIEPRTLYLLAESIFAYIDMLSAESAEGYALEQTRSAGEREMSRRRLVRLLVREPPAELEMVELAAREAGWELPRQLAAVAIQVQAGTALALPAGAIAERIGEILCAIVPDPLAPGRQAQIEAVLRRAGVRAGIGTSVAWRQAGLSFARARAALALAGAQTLVSAAEHTGELLLAADPVLAAEFTAARLAPLAELSAAGRERLSVTLAAWLDEQGRLAAVGARLGVHPQTVRYRLERLRELFGEQLDDPEARFWLALALRLDQAPATGTGSGATG
jgi:hypothetical protein